MSAPLRLGEIAERFGLALRGDPQRLIDGVATLAAAGPTQIAFLANPAYRRQLAGSAAAAVVLAQADADQHRGDVLISRNPYADFARIATLFAPATAARPGIHPSAVIEASAEIDPTAEIGPQVHVGARSRIAAGARIGPGCVIGEDCEIGAGCLLVARVTLVVRVRLGQRVIAHPGAVIGADGFGLAFDAGGWLKVPQLGGVRIGDDCEIGANTCIDRGALEDTVLEQDVRLDNLIQIGHNVVIGAHTAVAGCTAIAGSARIGRYCLIAGGVGVVGHIEIGDKVRVNAMSLVSRSLEGPGEYASGTPIQPVRAWRKSAARFRRLGQAAKPHSNQDKDSTDD